MLLVAMFYLFMLLSAINMLHFAAYLIGANLYDVKAMAQASKSRSLKRLRFRNPLVSVLIPAFNEELVIERCLESIRKNSYKKVEVIVNNDASKDKTAATIRGYINKYPNFNLRLVSRRSNEGKAAGLNYIGRKYANGSLVMTLDADSILHKQAIENAVKYFDDPEIVGVAANVRIIEETSVLGILQRFEHMVSYRSKKFYTVANCELIIGGVASTYRMSILKQVHFYDTNTVTEDIGLSVKIAAAGNKGSRMIYASDVAAMTEGVSDFKTLLRQRYRWKLGNLQNIFKYRKLLFSNDPKYTKSLTWYRFPMAFLGEFLLLVEPLVLSYLFYLSLRFMTPGLFVSAYMTISVYLLLNIWPDEHLTLLGKIKASVYIPALYFFFYIMNLVQLISAFRCVFNAKDIFHLSSGEKTWVSPKRLGRQASFS